MMTTNKFHIYTSWILYFWLLAVYTTAQERKPDLSFERISTRDGLSADYCYKIIKDKSGFIWVATVNGLNRYDGKRFDVFKKDRKDKHSIINNSVYGLTEDKSGRIWGITDDGLFFFDYKTEQITNFTFEGFEIKPSVTDVISDKTGKIVIGTINLGVLIFDPETLKFTTLSHDENVIASISSNNVGQNSILLDPKTGNILIATRHGLNILNPSTGKFINYRNHSGSPVINDHYFSALAISPQGHIWALDNNTSEILGFDTEKLNILYRIPLGDKLKHVASGTIFETSRNELWYSSISYETIKIDYNNSLTWKIIKSVPSDITTISADFFHHALEDNEGTIWLATVAGLCKYNRLKDFYRVFNTGKYFPDLEERNWEITCLAENPQDGSWWIGTRFGKLYYFEPNTEKHHIYSLRPSYFIENTSYIISDIDFINGKLIISFSSRYPAILLDPSNGKQEPFDLFERYGIKDYYPATLQIETDSSFLISNNLLPLYRWIPSKDKLSPVNYSREVLKEYPTAPGKWLKSFKNKGSWLSSEFFLGFVQPGDDVIIKYNFEYPQDDVFKSARTGWINALEVDSDANVWFTISGQGLFFLNGKDKSQKLWDSSDGFVSDVLISSLPDNFDQVWCAVGNNYSVLNYKTGNLINFHMEISTNNSFYYNYIIPLSNGNILTNIKGTLIEFFPYRLQTTLPPNPPRISSLITPRKSRLIYDQSSITLEADENFITINYGSLSDGKNTTYRYKYQLSGVTADWINAGQDGKAVFTNLNPGKYTFRLIRMNDAGKESEESILKFRIKAPFYKTWWFIVLFFGILLGAIGYVVVSRVRSSRNINSLISKAQLLEKEKTSVMYENLKQHLNPHFLFNSLTSLSSLIRINPKQASDFLDNMSKVYRYILRNKDNETVPLSEELSFVSMYIHLQKTRFEEGLHVDIDIPEEHLHRKIVPVTLQNLLENAIKHNTADPDQPLIIKLFIDDDYLVVTNTLQKKNYVETSNKQGQNSMVSLYRFLSSRPVIIEENSELYIVKIPLI